jgi:2-amino-4-hydroxy-6-hydroxymethyldihydropteridine diphosphokinase
MYLDPTETLAWHDAGRLHDAVRDASDAELRAIVGDDRMAAPLLHGPAAARLLERDGERRAEVLMAIEYHTVGHPRWDRTGRALYMADYLEPGRPFARDERAALAARVPHEFDDVFRAVVHQRVEWSRRSGIELHPFTLELWSCVR